jgi:hypothetical protein
MVLGLLLGELALALHFLDQRVVAGEPLEPAAAQPVGAAVADVADRDRFALGVDDRGGDRRPHPGPRRVVAGELVDRPVGRLDRLAKEGLRRAARQVAVEGVGRSLRCDLPRLGPAHAVGDDEDRRAHEVGILVGAALAAGVGSESLVVYAQHRVRLRSRI